MRREATFILILLLSAACVSADPENAQATTGTSGSYGTPAANAVSAQGGNVTEVNITSIAGTTRWQGFWGNVSASLVLGDGADTFYSWSGITAVAVYASPDTSVDWTSVTGLSSSAHKEAKDTDYGFDSSQADSINRTMAGNTCAAGTYINGAAGVTPLDNTGSPSSWNTCLAEDSGGTLTDTVFGTNVVLGGALAYNGQTVQFQLMVPTAISGTTYYFYLEI